MKNLLNLGGLLAIALGLEAGCVLPDPFSPRQVLAGKWQVTGAPFPMTTFLVFDAGGNLRQMLTKPASNVDVTDDLIGTQSTVSGNQVTFRYDIPLIGTRSFAGTLSDDKTTITGKSTLIVHILLTTITTDEGDVTLTKMAEQSS